MRRAGPKCKAAVEVTRRGWRTVPAQLGGLVVTAELEVVPYPRDAPRGLGLGVFTASASHLIRVRVRV